MQKDFLESLLRKSFVDKYTQFLTFGNVLYLRLIVLSHTCWGSNQDFARKVNHSCK